ncbi:MAG: Rrf2 family transcriptional regulator [Bacteroidales bacterium]|nr:Rrf2 family transcriptional regulator [Bacteroidales bacterium]
MKFSTRTRYGIRAMIEIARSSPELGILQKDISVNQEISNKYLDHIIHGLKVAGLIGNVRGRKSGYVLTRKAADITVYDIHNAFEPGICVIDCLGSTFKCDREEECEARGFWGRLNKQIRDYFKSITLLDLVENKAVMEDCK